MVLIIIAIFSGVAQLKSAEMGIVSGARHGPKGGGTVREGTLVIAEKKPPSANGTFKTR